MRRKRFQAIAGAVVLLVVGAACSGYGPVTSTARTVEQGQVNNVWTNFQIHSGSLNLSGGAQPLLDAHFTANQQLQPKVSYDTKSGQGWLTVIQPGVHHAVNFSAMRNQWDVRLSNQVPLEINTNASSGDTSLDLTGLQVTSAAITASSGDVVLNVGGEQHLLSEIDLDSSSGRSRIDLGGSYDHLTTLKVTSASGDVTLDLSGQWHDRLNGEVQSSSGSVIVRVPKNTPAVIHAGVTSGKVKASGFKSDGGTYTTAAYGSASAAITLDVTVASGQIILEQIG